MVTVGQVENDPYCVKVLEKHWPDVWRWADIRTLNPENIPEADVWSAGFPCVDISSAHTRTERKGLAGEHSGLWTEIVRLVEARQPRWLVLENSPRWRMWMPPVRTRLARAGYASVSLLLSAGSFGAPHRRPRGIVVAYADCGGEPLRTIHAEAFRYDPPPGSLWPPAPPSIVGVDDGVPTRLDRSRLKALGSAVVPQVAEWLGCKIVEASQ